MNLNGILGWMIDALDNAEATLITLISKVVVLIAPLIPAKIGYDHITVTMGWDVIWGWIYAGVVEGMGYTTIYKVFKWWTYNRLEAKEGAPRAPLGWAIVIYIIYLVTVLTVNAGLSVVSKAPAHEIIVVILISILGLPSGGMMAISAVHTEQRIASDREKKREERRMLREQARQANEQRTNVQPRQRTNVQPRQRTNETDNDEHYQTIIQETLRKVESLYPSDHKSQVLAFVSEIERTLGYRPGPSEIERAGLTSKGYASDVINRRV